MEIENELGIVFGCFYWLTYLGRERIGEAFDFYGETRFHVTGFDDAVEFDSVSNIYAVCLMKH